MLLLPCQASAWPLARTGAPRSRPVVGVTGDIYTRLNPVGNADLFRRLEQMGVEVWPSPYFATMSGLGAALAFPYRAERVMVRAAALDRLTQAVSGRVQQHFAQQLPAEVVELAVSERLASGTRSAPWRDLGRPRSRRRANSLTDRDLCHGMATAWPFR